MRHFLHLPLPPPDEIPGLNGEQLAPPVERLDPIAYHFTEF